MTQIPSKSIKKARRTEIKNNWLNINGSTMMMLIIYIIHSHTDPQHTALRRCTQIHASPETCMAMGQVSIGVKGHRSVTWLQVKDIRAPKVKRTSQTYISTRSTWIPQGSVHSSKLVWSKQGRRTSSQYDTFF